MIASDSLNPLPRKPHMDFSLILFGLASILGFSIYTADPYAISVEPISSGYLLEEDGYTSATLSSMLVAEINTIQQEASTSRGNRYTNSDKLQEKTSSAMTETLQITKPVKAVQLTLGLIPLTVTGAIVTLPSGNHEMMLTGYTSSGKIYKVRREVAEDVPIQTLVSDAALDLIGQLDLYVAANSYFKRERKTKDFTNTSRLVREGILHASREDLPWLYNLFGRMLHEEGRYEAAIEQYQNSLKVNPDFARAYLHWGRALVELKKYDDAMVQFDNALRLDPGYADVQVERARVLVEIGEPLKAMDAYAQALALDPYHGYAYYKWGELLQAQGETDKAIEALRRAIYLVPKEKDFQSALDRAISSRDNAFRDLSSPQYASKSVSPQAKDGH